MAKIWGRPNILKNIKILVLPQAQYVILANSHYFFGPQFP